MKYKSVTRDLSDSEDDGEVDVKELSTNKSASCEVVEDKERTRCAISDDDAVNVSSLTKPTVKQTASADKTWRETVKDAVKIAPYAGELNPKGYLHSALGFLSAYARTHRNMTSQPDQDMANEIVNFMAPKFDELAQLRTFRLQNFDCVPGLRLAKGKFGEVRTDKFMGKFPVAVKRITHHKDVLSIFKEVHTLIYVQNKRVLELYGAFHEQGVTHLVMEINNGTLCQNRDVLSRRQKIRFAIQLLEGVEYIHDRNIVHCNIRPANCFITSKNNVVLGEFAHSQLIPKDVTFLKTSKKALLGSPAYNDAMANRGFYAKSTDIFSLGATIFELGSIEPLMEYENWIDVPILEYIKVAEEGRLCNFPPSFQPDWLGMKKIWDLDGIREPLKDRVNTCLVFEKVVWDLVQAGSKRLSARQAIEKYRSSFDEQLAQFNLSRETLDNDLKLQNVKPCAQNAPLLQPSPISNKLSIAMDMVYYDANLNLASSKSGFVKELTPAFSAIPIDQLKKAVDEVCSKYAVQVEKTEDDMSTV